MSKRFAALFSVALAAAACGHPEKNVVDSYFNAVNANDTQTLSSFSAVTFSPGDKVERWRIKRTIKEDKTSVTLPDLVQKAKEADEAIAANKKAASAWSLDHYNEIDQIREARKKGQPVPGKLAEPAKKWDEFNEKDRELKRDLANAKDAVEREKRNVDRSVGDVENIETLKGDILEKQIEIDLTIKGQVTPYVMTLRRYDIKREGAGPRIMNRWVIQNLQKM